MIPERIVEFIHGPVFISIGTRDDKLRPAHAWVIGAVVGPDRKTVTCLVPEPQAKEALPNLETNGQIALNAGSPTHEAYQLKGRFLSARPADEKDRAIQEIYRSKLLAFALRYYPEQIATPLILGFAYQLAMAITFLVEEVFLQTPGPDAGKKIQ